MRDGSERIEVACHAGRLFAFTPRQTALVVIDMQRDFLAPGGMCDVEGEPIDRLAPVVPSIQAVLEAVRRARMTEVHTREGFAADLSDLPPLRRERGSVGRTGPLRRFLVRGEPGHDFIDELKPASGELVVDKPGFGAFFGTSLHDGLERLDVRHLILTGVTTQCCVQSTLREAVDRGFYCLLLADCTAAFDPALHEATLAMIRAERDLLGWVADSSALLAALSG